MSQVWGSTEFEKSCVLTALPLAQFRSWHTVAGLINGMLDGTDVLTWALLLRVQDSAARPGDTFMGMAASDVPLSGLSGAAPGRRVPSSLAQGWVCSLESKFNDFFS